MVNGKTKYYQIRGFYEYGILVPTTVPVDLAVKLIASIQCHRLRNKSVDNVLKNYPNGEEEIKKQYTGDGSSGIVGMTFIGDILEWKKLSKLGIVCGFNGCMKKPIVKCKCCGEVFCEEHKNYLKLAHKHEQK